MTTRCPRAEGSAKHGEQTGTNNALFLSLDYRINRQSGFHGHNKESEYRLVPFRLDLTTSPLARKVASGAFGRSCCPLPGREY